MIPNLPSQQAKNQFFNSTSKQHSLLYPQLLLLHNENKRLIVVGIQISHLDRCLLLLANPLALSVQELDLHVRIY